MVMYQSNPNHATTLQFQSISDSLSHERVVLTNETPPLDSWLFWTNRHQGTRYLSVSVFLLTPLLTTEKLSDSNVLKVIPIQVTEVQCFSHMRRPARGIRAYWDPSKPLGNHFVLCA